MKNAMGRSVTWMSSHEAMIDDEFGAIITKLKLQKMYRSTAHTTHTVIKQTQYTWYQWTEFNESMIFLENIIYIWKSLIMNIQYCVRDESSINRTKIIKIQCQPPGIIKMGKLLYVHSKSAKKNKYEWYTWKMRKLHRIGANTTQRHQITTDYFNSNDSFVSFDLILL